MASRTVEIRVNSDEIFDRIPEIKEAFVKAERFDRIKAMLTQPDARHLSWEDAYILICELVLITNEAL